MTECKKCDLVLEDVWLACPRCGTLRDQMLQCISCRHLIDYQGSSFCPYCGSPQVSPQVSSKPFSVSSAEVSGTYILPGSKVGILKDALLFRSDAILEIGGSSHYNLFAFVSVFLLILGESLFNSPSGFFFTRSGAIFSGLWATSLSFIGVYSFFLSILGEDTRQSTIFRLYGISTFYGLLGLVFKVLIFLYLSIFGGRSLFDLASNVVSIIVLILIFSQLVIYCMKILHMTSGGSIVLNFLLFGSIFTLREFFSLYFSLPLL